MTRQVPMLLTLLACVVDNKLDENADPPVPLDTGDVVDTGPREDSAGETDTTTTPPEEVCNGVDDDGDGDVDEGYPDADGNGRVDCLDSECPPLTLPEATTVETTCSGDPWDIEIEWQETFEMGSYSPPLVGRLADTNGDGAVDDADLPVVVVTDIWGLLRVYAGDGSGLLFSIEGVHGIASGALADVTGDGTVELVTPMGDGSVAAFDGKGAKVWSSAVVSDPRIFPTVSVGDLDGDGTVEVVTPNAVLSGADGSFRFGFPLELERQLLPTVVDLDGDGSSEILLGRTWYNADGAEIWQDPERGFIAEFNAVLDADGDGRGDVVTVSQRRMSRQRADASFVWDVALDGDREPGPPAVADFDGDGTSEICVPNNDRLTLFELDGSVLWEAEMSDYSGWAGCAGFDMDGDGGMEALVAGEYGFRIYDGPTGEIVFDDPDHASGTGFEYPVVADVDDDGSAEVVVIDSMGGYNGVTVYGEVDDAWPDVGETWGVYDLPLSAIAPDGSVRAPAPAPWTPENLFHARTGTPVWTPSPDLVVEVDDACVADCDFGPAILGFHVANIGAADVEAGTSITVRRGDNTVIAVLALGAVPSGVALAAVSVALTPEDLAAGPLTVTVDDDGTGAGAVTECEETNNVATWDPGCGG